ncbi:hypothetical protein C5F59_027140 [Streptomyces sp. QL37]|uniref:hypothetical protein n=1 Tax=Streptomyces sp. QL37 TaxID=2093747 RepID=UPI000CF1E616|nr:hypothetical protein [Streptomyces sp. QL37]PPQ57206.1 hypothetical protein C5F59_11285 [Streptomyces sp. QL37]
MHTTISPFTLAYLKERQPVGLTKSGWQGTSAEFGGIRVVYPAGRDTPDAIVTEARGGLIPTAVFETRGPHAEIVSMPTLNRSTLRVGDGLVRMSRNRWAPTHRGRALRMTYLGDVYVLRAVNRRAYELSRRPDSEDPGSVVTVRQSGLGNGRRMTVRAAGRVLPADVALAVLFTGVDRSVLTRRGAVRAGFSRIFNFWAESQA